MVSCMSLTGSMPLPVVSKFRVVQGITKPGSYERVQATLPLVAELEEDLDELFYSIALNGMLMIARMSNQDTPSSDRLRSLYCKFKGNLRADPMFLREVMDRMPDIMAKYSTDDITQIVADKEFLSLLSS